jgi:hypothetical protein
VPGEAMTGGTTETATMTATATETETERGVTETEGGIGTGTTAEAAAAGESTSVTPTCLRRSLCFVTCILTPRRTRSPSTLHRLC